MLALRANPERGFTCAIGIGGIGAGMIYALQGDHELGRNESRLGELLDSRDYCKLHIALHYIARLMDSHRERDFFRVWPVGVVGNDTAGRQILAEMNAAGMDTRFVRTHPALKTPFSVCFMYPDGSGGNITSSNSAAGALTADDLRAALPYMKSAGARGVALCAPEVPLRLRREFLELASKCGNYRVCSFVLGEIEEARKTGLIELADLLALNEEEASALLGNAPGEILDEATLVQRAEELTATRANLRVIISAGKKGAHGFEDGRSQYCPAPELNAISTAGAGDALLAGVVSALAACIPFIIPTARGRSFSGRMLGSALDFGVLNGSFSVTSPHTIHPEADVETLFSFARSHAASVADSLRSACCMCEETVPVADKP
ncbi:MAG TPA: PfkB family carbohydrate kinase [Dongiaceae bacterium]|nr:PfkB family carbohydrate kinase [Dongiaceae bacterium]